MIQTRHIHLLALDGAKERLSLFEANLTLEGSFDSAVDGCLCVFHTASPVLLSVDDPQTQLIDPAVKGTLNVLKSAAKVQSLKRVVLTSSMSAILAEDMLLNLQMRMVLELVVYKSWICDRSFFQPTLNITSEGIMSLITNGNCRL
ncbi:putative 3-beta hydroxysteroid dehydrogenase/isomerase, NAD(P)-binding domain superfamily [Helianthus annuus]|nr:putative 3-beta hydroxysteroid dehydrogenase/isomerase, NAD(P)-binding domain superfamily [Helianthus annuus]